MEQEHIDRIEAYLAGKMDKTEIQRFESELAQDPELHQLYRETQLAMAAVDQQLEDELRESFVTWKAEAEPKRQPSWLTSNYLKIAASLALLFSLYLIFRPTDTPMTGMQMAMEAYEAPPAPDNTMGGRDLAWATGTEAYRQGEFDKAVEAWLSLKGTHPEVDYYLAHAHFGAEDFPAAIPLFEALSQGNSIYNYPADWYLTLAYLATNTMDAVRERLKKILSDENHPFYDEAQYLSSKVAKISR